MAYVENLADLSHRVVDTHRAIESLKEELEAIDNNNQRIELCVSRELKEILIYNRNQKDEHASLLIEWLAKKDIHFQKQLKKTLFKHKTISVAKEDEYILNV